MAQASFSLLYPRLSVVIKGAPNPTLKLALQQASREFARRSRAYRATITPTDVAANATAIAPTLPDDTEVYAPGDMTFRDNPLETTSANRANFSIGRWDDTRNATSHPGHIMRVSATALALVPIPSQATTGELRGTVILLPARDADGIEEDFMDDYGDGIVFGAIATLAAMKGTAWFAPDIVDYYEAEFSKAINEAEIRARNEHTYNGGTVAYGGL
jgi:hypothetical protein